MGRWPWAAGVSPLGRLGLAGAGGSAGRRRAILALGNGSHILRSCEFGIRDGGGLMEAAGRRMAAAPRWQCSVCDGISLFGLIRVAHCALRSAGYFSFARVLTIISAYGRRLVLGLCSVSQCL